MRIKLLLNIGTSETEYPHLKEGEHDVSAADGMKLIERGWAIPLESPAKPIKAVPPESSIKTAVAQATSDLKTYRDKTSRSTDHKTPANKEQ